MLIHRAEPARACQCVRP